MSYLIHLAIGFGMSYLGFLPPGMLNMTAVRQTIEKGLPSAALFSLGAATTVGVQAAIALFFADLLRTQPIILEVLQYAAIPIFVLLAYYFYRQGKREIKSNDKKTNQRPYFAGLLLATFNTIAIPFYFGYCSIFAHKGWIKMEMPFTLFIIAGAALGAFALFVTYSKFAEYIVSKIQFVARNINFILSAFFLLMALIMIFRQLNEL